MKIYEKKIVNILDNFFLFKELRVWEVRNHCQAKLKN